jgi:hypothetical protein
VKKQYTNISTQLDKQELDQIFNWLISNDLYKYVKGLEFKEKIKNVEELFTKIHKLHSNLCKLVHTRTICQA